MAGRLRRVVSVPFCARLDRKVRRATPARANWTNPLASGWLLVSEGATSAPFSITFLGGADQLSPQAVVGVAS
jgi:hypothetical protein